MPTILIKRPAQPLKRAERVQTAPKPKTPRNAKAKAPYQRPRQYLFHRVKVENETPRMTRKQFHRWWLKDSGEFTPTPFQLKCEELAYERYKTTGDRFLKPHESNYGTGTDFPPNFQPPKAVKKLIIKRKKK